MNQMLKNYEVGLKTIRHITDVLDFGAGDVLGVSRSHFQTLLPRMRARNLNEG